MITNILHFRGSKYYSETRYLIKYGNGFIEISNGVFYHVLNTNGVMTPDFEDTIKEKYGFKLMRNRSAKSDIIVLEKGKAIKYLDYVIHNSANNDGLCLLKKKPYDQLGNYGIGTQKNIDNCKLAATIFFMLERPVFFKQSIRNKLREKTSGTMHEYYSFKKCCEMEGIEMPAEITPSKDGNALILFNGKLLTHKNN